ncbi:MAG TPA: hypothetical protein VMF89_19510, partial [Polyangiales bacterium]|nr:hypothetical protein [Polyangiales bacterium]
SSLVYYAMGGGLGHLTRARAVLHTLGYEGRVTLISASEHARDARVVGDCEVAFVPQGLECDSRAFVGWISATLRAAAADCLCVDTFPAGILGELSELRAPGVALWHVARRLRWSRYRTHITEALHFDRIYVVETLEADHEEYLRAHSATLERLCLRDPPSGLATVPLTAAAYWLVIHSGPVAEVEEILAYAAELRALAGADVELCVLSPHPPATLPAATRVLNVYPAQSYLAAAARIFSAAGFNTMRECAPYRAKHTILPMPRRYDDQFERARQARAPDARS